jgi:hypothetical protein
MTMRLGLIINEATNQKDMHRKTKKTKQTKELWMNKVKTSHTAHGDKIIKKESNDSFICCSFSSFVY